MNRLLSPFLKTFFRLLYHQAAFTYDWVAAAVSLGRWKRWVFTTLPYLPGPRVLEIGHGPGHLLVALSRQVQFCAGLDESIQMGRQAGRKLERSANAPRLVRALGQAIPFASGSFDQVVATFPTEYIARPETLAEIHRLLQPDGEFVLMPVAWITGKGIVDHGLAWLFRFTGQSPRLDERFQPERLVHGELGKPFREAGFTLSAEFIDLGDSQVLLVRAKKVL